jgi:hypothetical protein
VQPDTATAERIYKNIQVLLSNGQFPGSHAAAVAEAQSFLDLIVKQLEEVNVQAGTETGSSVQSEADAGRVGRESGRNRGKQGRKSKAK